MKLIIKFLSIISLLFLLSCDDSNDWYVGKWVMDEEYTRSMVSLFDNQQIESVNQRLESFKGYVVYLEKEEGFLIKPDLSIDEKYVIKHNLNEDTIVLFKDGKKQVIIYKGDNRLYYSFDSEEVTDEVPKMFLKRM